MLIQPVPTCFTIKAITTYTRPAMTAPIIRPAKPADTDAAPAKAVSMEPIKAKDEPRKAGTFNLVRTWKSSVPMPAKSRVACTERPGLEALKRRYEAALESAIEAMESVLAQTVRDIELIIADDCSTDDTEALVRSMPDERIRYLRLVTNQGACAALS